MFLVLFLWCWSLVLKKSKVVMWGKNTSEISNEEMRCIFCCFSNITIVVFYRRMVLSWSIAKSSNTKHQTGRCIFWEVWWWKIKLNYLSKLLSTYSNIFVNWLGVKMVVYFLIHDIMTRKRHVFVMILRLVNSKMERHNCVEKL